MLKRWRESEWGRLRRRKDLKPVNGKQWVGTSFDVGDFLGVDMLGGDAPKPASAEPSIVDEYPPPSHAPTSTVGTDFVTAPSTLSRPNGIPTQPSDASLRVLNAQSRLSAHGHEEDSRPISADSSTALLPPRIVVEDPFGGVHSEILARSLSSVGPILTSGESDTNLITGHASGKGKRVHYVDTPLPAPSPTGAPAEDPPAPAEEVLARTGSEVLDTSAGAVEQSSLQNQEKWGDVIMRDRMLVRVSYTDATTVGADFDESQDRVNPHIHSDNWMEYIVAWRKDRLELYRDHVTPGKEWLTGHKHLAFVIPMEFTTHLSIYSFIDLTFCLTCPPTPLRARSKNRALLYATRKGTNIFIFKSKSRTRAVDWVWHLWRHMGGSLPPFIEIRIPALDTRMKIDIPGGSEGNIEGAYAIFNRANVLALCRRALSQSKQHDIYAQRILAEGSSLELAWRIDTSLDWVWQTEDVEGNPRDWSVLCGLALTQGRKPAHLELRRREHLPNRLYLKDGTYLDEPPSIEGFVDRIRPSTQFKQSIYLSTHDGYLFSLPINQAYPPMPPGPRIDAKDAESLHASEVHRGTEQIMHSIGALDLRAIVAIRRAIQHVPVQTANVTPASNWEDGAEFWAEVDTTDEDDLDKGGEEGFVAASDKAKLKVRRSFELLLISGRVIRFETYSCTVALEWITRLRQLVSYWRKRHQTDARQEMDLAHHVAGKPQLTPHARISDGTPDSPPDPDASLPDLSRFFNWCVLDGCRAILKCGRLFGRKGLRGMYKHILLVLVAGHVVQFRITGESALHRRRKSINLLDAYVCSGYLAAQHLPEGQFNPNSPPLARRYQDGLESDESEEDTLFVLWYRPNTGVLDQTLTLAGSSQTPPSAGKMEIPPLDAKRKLGVFRTRSKLERDAWVWAINAEIDKTVRLAKERESKVRDAGMLMTT
ncbi:Pleckstrin homology domain-containing protein [Cristinia sonorae]|uniref:Pleckstrin homology domain-containing protein n=1 Tax=Cristinia sonorae TaxID=1940300 RepID=A0A8K0UVN7_9AGAR|nr:Pleckstrin homology domain-containing protein [Cristinia sonorae]